MPAPPQDQVLIALGSNEGDRRAIILKALEEIAVHCGPIRAQSSLQETEPVGVADKMFLNGVCIITTALAPEQLLNALMKIERTLGRVRTVHWGNRTIDLDIILWKKADGTMLQHGSPSLTIPHPRALERPFVMDPAKEIAADWFSQKQ